jgi:hypothetical protein
MSPCPPRAAGLALRRQFGRFIVDLSLEREDFGSRSEPPTLGYTGSSIFGNLIEQRTTSGWRRAAADNFAQRFEHLAEVKRKFANLAIAGFPEGNLPQRRFLFPFHFFLKAGSNLTPDP